MRKIPATLFFCLFTIFGAAVLAKLFYLQVVKGEYYEALALGQQMSVEDINAQRGDIFFSDGKTILAQTKTKPVVYISPSKISQSDIDLVAKELALALEGSEEDIKEQIQQGEIFKKDITEKQYETLKQKNLNGVYINEVSTRVYPQKEYACHMAGFVNNEGQGQYGIEGYYDSILQGENISEGKSSTLGILTSVFSGKDTDLQTKGESLQLTIDYNIQYYAEKMLNEAFDQWKMDSGQIIVQEPQTGKILALATYPDFDPNQYSQEKNMGIFLNSSLQALFEPGSVFKPFTMAGALEENLIAPETKFTDTGVVNVGGPAIYNFAKKTWGEQSMVGVLENSINTGAVFVEQKLGKNLFLKYAQKFGFFDKTNIDLAGEVFSSNETLKNGYPRDLATASFGQGIQMTSMQLIRGFSVIANAGKMMRPYVVEKIIEPNGQEKIQEPVFEKQVISEDTASKLSAMMVSVVENGGGRRAKVPHYYIAGKTGTAQIPKPKGGYYETETIQSFIGFAPAFSPRFVILVRLDNPKQSDAASSCAAPIFGKLAKYIIDLWQIPPSE